VWRRANQEEIGIADRKQGTGAAKGAADFMAPDDFSAVVDNNQSGA